VREKVIIILCLAGLLSGFYLVWIALNRRGKSLRRVRSNPSSKKTNRAGDQRVLTAMERQVIDRAKELARESHFVQASQLLEQVGLHREAITLLEDKKFFDEAAAILLRLQRPNRVGVLYARNGLWAKAAPFFLQAGQVLEAAKAFREAGLFKEAAELFHREQNHADAAECFEQIGLFADAARHWTRANNGDRAINCWDKFGLMSHAISSDTISEEEFQLISNAIANGQTKKGLWSLIARGPSVSRCAIACVKAGHRGSAKEVLKRASPDQYLDIVADTTVDAKNGKIIAEILFELAHHKFAANLFERHGYFTQAADAYAAAGDEDRARYCRTRQTTDRPNKDIQPQDIGQMPKITTASTHSSSSASTSAAQFFIEPTKHNLQIPQSWLFRDLPTDLCAQFTARLKPLTITTGQTIRSGAPEAKLVYVIEGEIRADHMVTSGAEWAGIEGALSDQDTILWTAVKDTSVAIMTADDFYDLFNRNGVLTRTVYKNLTQRLHSSQRNPSILKAI
jgi:tetratricopeptide (TPR) repeat protein